MTVNSLINSASKLALAGFAAAGVAGCAPQVQYLNPPVASPAPVADTSVNGNAPDYEKRPGNFLGGSERTTSSEVPIENTDRCVITTIGADSACIHTLRSEDEVQVAQYGGPLMTVRKLKHKGQVVTGGLSVAGDLGRTAHGAGALAAGVGGAMYGDAALRGKTADIDTSVSNVSAAGGVSSSTSSSNQTQSEKQQQTATGGQGGAGGQGGTGAIATGTGAAASNAGPAVGCGQSASITGGSSSGNNGKSNNITCPDANAAYGYSLNQPAVDHSIITPGTDSGVKGSADGSDAADFIKPEIILPARLGGTSKKVIFTAPKNLMIG